MRPVTRMSLVPIALLAGCDVPTSAPQYTTEWNVPAKSTTISVNTFLPAGVTAAPDNSAFQVAVSPSSASIQRSLGQDCTACSAANGQTIPKPAFNGGGTTTLNLPSGVATATLVRDTLTLTITNGFNFDPIRPSAGARGYLVIRVANGSTVVGRDSLDGSAIALAPSTNTVRKIPLAGTITGSAGLVISTTLSSPQGDPVAINAAQTLTVSGSVGSVFISSASVNLASQQVASSSTSLDLSSVDKSISDHVNGGQLLLTVTNPFAATGNLNVTLSGGPSTIVKPVSLGTGTTTPAITLTSTELKSLFGNNISVTFTGTVTGANVTVTPGQTVAVSARLQLGVNVGGTN